MKEIVIRRGPHQWEWKHREEANSKFKNTLVPTYPECKGAVSCKWCAGMKDPMGQLMTFPIRALSTEGIPLHTITPPQAAHLVALEYNSFHPGETFRVGWLLTDEEVQAGKTGFEWPGDV